MAAYGIAYGFSAHPAGSGAAGGGESHGGRKVVQMLKSKLERFRELLAQAEAEPGEVSEVTARAVDAAFLEIKSAPIATLADFGAWIEAHDEFGEEVDTGAALRHVRAISVAVAL